MLRGYHAPTEPKRSRLGFPLPAGLLGALRGYTPVVAAVVAALVFGGRRELATIGARLGHWRVRPTLWVLAVVGPLAAGLLVVLLARVSGHDLGFDRHAVRPAKLVLIFFAFALIDGPLGEEIGWRGDLLPKLLERRGPIVASLIVGGVWYLWHLPLYAATGRFELTAGFLAGYLANNLAFSFLHTWFFQRSGGSALLAVVLHTAGNYAVYLSVALCPALPSAPARRIHLAVLVAAGLAAAVALAAPERDRRPTGAGAPPSPDG
jgi:membrane protease YdiL (CAAX protease family)